jgi:hypothetical protein
MTPLRTPADLLALVPYLLGFHPSDSLVVIALRDGEIVFELRGDLPGTGGQSLTNVELARAVSAAADHFTALVVRQRASHAMVVGYGDPAAATPVALAVGRSLQVHRIKVADVLRATRDRYWSCLCTNPVCCPPEGKPYDVRASVIAAEAAYDGRMVLPCRSDLARRLEPTVGSEREHMKAATRRAGRRLVELIGESAGSGEAAAAVRDAGSRAIGDAIGRHRVGGWLDDDELAWLCVLLQHIPVRDHAMQVTGELATQIGLWTDVVRRAEPELTAAPGTLLAFAAWRAGEGAICAIALDHVQRIDPRYAMARLLDRALAGGVSPREWADICGRLPARIDRPTPPLTVRSMKSTWG